MKKTRSILIALLSFVLLLSMAFGVVACGGDGNNTGNNSGGNTGGGSADNGGPVVIVTLNKTKLEFDTMSSGEKLTAKVTIDGIIVDNPTLSWKSSNNSVVAVSSDGMVTVNGVVGDAAITCTYEQASASCIVKVTKYYVPQVKIILNSYGLDIPFESGFTYDIVAKAVLAEDIKNEVETAIFTFESSDKDVATVTTDGKVTIVGRGDCVIIVSTVVNGVKTSATFTISVELEDTEGGYAPDKDWA
jgi:hypothetical protein